MVNTHNDLKEINVKLLTIKDLEFIYNSRGYYLLCENGEGIIFVEETKEN